MQAGWGHILHRRLLPNAELSYQSRSNPTSQNTFGIVTATNLVNAASL
jgi:hypothetical protein